MQQPFLLTQRRLKEALDPSRCPSAEYEAAASNLKASKTCFIYCGLRVAVTPETCASMVRLESF